MVRRLIWKSGDTGVFLAISDRIQDEAGSRFSISVL